MFFKLSKLNRIISKKLVKSFCVQVGEVLLAEVWKELNGYEMSHVVVP